MKLGKLYKFEFLGKAHQKSFEYVYSLNFTKEREFGHLYIGDSFIFLKEEIYNKSYNLRYEFRNVIYYKIIHNDKIGFLNSNHIVSQSYLEDWIKNDYSEDLLNKYRICNYFTEIKDE